MQIENKMSVDNVAMFPEDAEKTYRLSCEVKKKTITLTNNGVPYESTVVYLVVLEGNQKIAFFNAYLPEYVVETEENRPNEQVFVNRRTNRAFRGALSLATKLIPERHIFIMTNDESDYLKSIFKEKMKVEIDCVPFSTQKDYDV